jgi:hypothetical protein
VSVPQKAEVDTNNVPFSTIYTQSGGYVPTQQNITDAPDTDQVHNGFVINATSNPRIAFTYTTADNFADEETSGPLSTGVTLSQGWNLVGTNNQISQHPDISLGAQLENVDPFDKDDAGQNNKAYIVDTGFGQPLGGNENFNTSDLSRNDVVTTQAANGTYQAFWVYVDDTNGFDNTRNVDNPEYNPANRANLVP